LLRLNTQVGWVERSEAQQKYIINLDVLGFASLAQPTIAGIKNEQ
jgi:hypothetical protein